MGMSRDSGGKFLVNVGSTRNIQAEFQFGFFVVSSSRKSHCTLCPLPIFSGGVSHLILLDVS